MKKGKRKPGWEQYDSIPLNRNGTTTGIRLGENMISVATKELAKLLELPNWKRMTNHSNRRHAITVMGNDKNVHMGAAMTTARHHGSKPCHVGYQDTRNSVTTSHVQDSLQGVSSLFFICI